MALEAFPPLLLVGGRFLLSGSLLLAAARLAGVRMPVRKDALRSALFGVLILGVGNSCLTYAELWIPSGLAALLVTTSPFWMVGLEAVWPGGERLRLITVLGMLVGLGGAALLLSRSAVTEGLGGDTVKGFLILQVGCVAWSFGSIAQMRRMSHLNAVVNGAIQQLGAGIAILIPAVLLGQTSFSGSWRGAGAQTSPGTVETVWGTTGRTRGRDR